MTSPTSLQTRILPKKKSRIRVLDSSVQIVCEDDPGKISWKWGKNGVFAPNKAKYESEQVRSIGQEEGRR